MNFEKPSHYFQLIEYMFLATMPIWGVAPNSPHSFPTQIAVME